jgi:hypothetical protein
MQTILKTTYLKKDFTEMHYNQIVKNQWERILKATRKKQVVTRECCIRLSADFFAETCKAWVGWDVRSAESKRWLIKNTILNNTVFLK